MSKLTFTTRAVRSVKTTSGPPLTRQDQKDPFQISAVRRANALPNKVHAVLEFTEPHRIKSLTFKNAASAFLTVLAGTESEWEALATSPTPFEYLSQLSTLIPETQLCTEAQYNIPSNLQNTPQSPLYRPKSFLSKNLNRYIANQAYKFLVLELRPFMDAQVKRCGISWVEIYGEKAGEVSEDEINQMLSASINNSQSSSQSSNFSIDDNWMKDQDGDTAMGGSASSGGSGSQQSGATPTGFAAFKPTGEAERLLRIQEANAPPKPSIAQQAKPILNRNATFLNDLRGGAAASSSASPAAASSSTPRPPSCPHHPTAMLTQRIDRKLNKPFFVCLAKDAQGKTCDNRIDV